MLRRLSWSRSRSGCLHWRRRRRWCRGWGWGWCRFRRFSGSRRCLRRRLSDDRRRLDDLSRRRARAAFLRRQNFANRFAGFYGFLLLGSDFFRHLLTELRHAGLLDVAGFWQNSNTALLSGRPDVLFVLFFFLLLFVGRWPLRRRLFGGRRTVFYCGVAHGSVVHWQGSKKRLHVRTVVAFVYLHCSASETSIALADTL